MINTFRTRFGVYIDDHPNMVCTDKYLDRVIDVGYDQMRIMVDSARADWDMRYSIRQLKILRHLAMVERNIEQVFVFWPIPHRKTLDRMEVDLDRMIGETGVTALSAELEGLMLDRVAKQYGWDIISAKQYLYEMMCRLSEKHDVTVEGTTHPAHPEAQAPDPNKPSRGYLASRVRRMVWQIYPTRHRIDGSINHWFGRYGPVNRAKDVMRLAKLSALYGQERPCFATNVWDVLFPGHTLEEIMDLNVNTLLQYNPEIIADWMSGNTVGRFRNNGINPHITNIRRQIIRRIKEAA